jgi:hypothetical protein
MNRFTLALATVALVAAVAGHAASTGCTHACSRCDYAPGSGAQMEYDRTHRVPLAQKCHWNANQICWSTGRTDCPTD